MLEIKVLARVADNRDYNADINGVWMEVVAVLL